MNRPTPNMAATQRVERAKAQQVRLENNKTKYGSIERLPKVIVRNLSNNFFQKVVKGLNN